jgi:coenzyme F420-reducing hydrogenase delta subunit
MSASEKKKEAQTDEKSEGKTPRPPRPKKEKAQKQAEMPEQDKSEAPSAFEPRIIAFLCNWCSYAGADLAGVSRYQYPTNTRTVRVMCSSRVDPVLMLEMFIHGADGVLVGGCHLGDCHYISGNYYTEKKFKMAKRMLEKAGFEPKRLRLEWVSASEGERFSKVIADFVDEVRNLGPNPVAGDNPDIDKLVGLFVAKNAAGDFRLRSLVAREIDLTEKGNVYDKKVPQEEFDVLMERIMDEEMERQKILLMTMDEPSSVLDIASKVNLSPQKVLTHIVTLKDRGLITVDRFEGVMPLYITPKEVVMK